MKLQPYSDTLDVLLKELRHWGGNHREKIKQAMRDGVVMTNSDSET